MKKTSASLMALAAIVVVANAAALLHGLTNRIGRSEADVILTQRELVYPEAAQESSNSGITLYLQWIFPDQSPGPVWLDQQKLAALGFDCSVDPNTPDAPRFYARQRPRQAYVALEYEGPAWREWQQMREQALSQEIGGMPGAKLTPDADASHLVAMDADLDADRLRARLANLPAVIVVPAVIAIGLTPSPYMRVRTGATQPARLMGRIEQVPTAIHVPLPFSSQLRQLKRSQQGKSVSYRIHLRYGPSLEPWVTGIDIPAQ